MRRPVDREIPRHVVTPDRQLPMALPPDTDAEGVRRLGWLAIVYAIANVAGPFARLVLAAVEGTIDASDYAIPDMFGLAAVIMAFAIFVAVRRRAFPPRRLLDWGLVFQVAGALGLAVREFWHGVPTTAGGWFLIPGECVLLVAYPLLVPTSPRKVLVTSLIAASMGPAGLFISAAANGAAVGGPIDVAAYFLTSNYLCAIVGYAIARIVHRVNVQLTTARDIGSYHLIDRIGAGGMGEVWRAEHRLLARPAAVKLIRSRVLGESYWGRDALARRFEREARETAALGSTHTVAVYDFGVTEQGDFFYAMELLDGLSLERLVQEFGAMDPGRTVYVLQQVCHSLGEAHARNLVHRDVKPANIMVCRLGPDTDFVKVLDFGLVKHTSGAPTLPILSVEGTVMGTPTYMAPEVALGHANVDWRADIYSLGCVAYYMLTGQVVFSGDTPLATALAHVRNAPVPPRLRSELSIPSALDALIMECLAKDPAARPSSAGVVSKRLAQAVAADAWTLDAARTWWERHQPVTGFSLSDAAS
jgi:serine/threonine-protein kinase